MKNYLKLPVLVAMTIFALAACTQTPAEPETVDISPLANLSISQGDTIESGMEIRGEVPGTWYFEATFGVELKDSNNNSVFMAPAIATADWMTEEMVPFAVQVPNFQISADQGGTLIFSKANASGLPEHDQSVELPVQIQKSSTQTVFLSYALRDSEMLDCSETVAETREVTAAEDIYTATLEALLAGPTTANYITSIPEGTTLNSVKFENGTVTADFSSELNTAAGSCMVTQIRAQIEQTLYQFNEVAGVVISVDGETEEILQP